MADNKDHSDMVRSVPAAALRLPSQRFLPCFLQSRYVSRHDHIIVGKDFQLAAVCYFANPGVRNAGQGGLEGDRILGPNFAKEAGVRLAEQ